MNPSGKLPYPTFVSLDLPYFNQLDRSPVICDAFPFLNSVTAVVGVDKSQHSERTVANVVEAGRRLEYECYSNCDDPVSLPCNPILLWQR